MSVNADKWLEITILRSSRGYDSFFSTIPRGGQFLLEINVSSKSR
jgi:hypothetical protein